MRSDNFDGVAVVMDDDGRLWLEDHKLGRICEVESGDTLGVLLRTVASSLGIYLEDN